VLGVQAELDERDVGPLPRGRCPDLVDLGLARDHLVSEPGNDLREHLEPLEPLIRDQDTELLHLFLGHEGLRRKATNAEDTHAEPQQPALVQRPCGVPPSAGRWEDPPSAA
jgi:hypothetical protein